ncbi:hypothetical protein LLH06_03155 [Mucilaginibacter daejeonensis]|uniref:hypothetical protein n=1 Tax=Mucilaginibacter daejeonensis TaxID=398049 RepID=UPI001D17ABD2|nr:hypothetical protein [Mucilaginibacter daejeonensis]UEG53970.1 hypothetical protein LLH06_03155 [Mucilaginibacter daejeonensis]
MTNQLKLTVLALFMGLMVLSTISVKAQCAMCSATAEAGVKDGNTEANGLNNGIMYLLAAPYIAVAVVGYVWYKKYRRKNVDINMSNEKLHLN